MDEIEIRLSLYRTENGYGIYLSDYIGGSGIEVEESTKEECANAITPYIKDYLYRLDDEE